MAKLFDFEKEDVAFVEKTLNSDERGELIWRLEKSRKFMIVLLAGLIVLILVSDIFGVGQISAGFMLVTVLQSVVYSNVDARIKMLKLFDKMQSAQLIGTMQSVDR